ncbi:cell division protein FtsQ/DivIB [Bacillus sp. 03113]|uniref:cell division protein FtsQ/DivIB n=1 Tax=Bacillus sp. 03113 TaxID=2578211 RepID=UPI001142FBD0|nr:cell division protein FtsQ/DivIB [Bacillus sp. 03113]
MEKGKIVSIEDRIPKLKQQRRRKANRRLITLLFLFFSLIVGVIYFQSPLSRVKQIVVQGNEVYPPEKIIEISKINKKTNIWKINEGNIEQRLKKLPEMKSIEIKKKWPNTVIINVTEFRKMAYVIKEKHYMPVLENGNILTEEKISAVPVNAPILFNFSEGSYTKEMINALKKLPVEIANSISEIHYAPKKTDAYHITLFMNDGYEVSATIRSFSEKMSLYPSIVSQLDPKEKGVIDLEVGSYFKAYANDETKKDEEDREE